MHPITKVVDKSCYTKKLCVKLLSDKGIDA